MKQFMENVGEYFRNEFPEYIIKTDENGKISFTKDKRILSLTIGHLNELIWDERSEKGRDIEGYVLQSLKNTIVRELEHLESKV
jgi:hypothetical protein